MRESYDYLCRSWSARRRRQAHPDCARAAGCQPAVVAVTSRRAWHGLRKKEFTGIHVKMARRAVLRPGRGPPVENAVTVSQKGSTSRAGNPKSRGTIDPLFPGSRRGLTRVRPFFNDARRSRAVQAAPESLVHEVLTCDTFGARLRGGRWSLALRNVWRPGR